MSKIFPSDVNGNSYNHSRNPPFGAPTRKAELVLDNSEQAGRCSSGLSVKSYSSAESNSIPLYLSSTKAANNSYTALKRKNKEMQQEKEGQKRVKENNDSYCAKEGYYSKLPSPIKSLNREISCLAQARPIPPNQMNAFNVELVSATQINPDNSNVIIPFTVPDEDECQFLSVKKNEPKLGEQMTKLKAQIKGAINKFVNTIFRNRPPELDKSVEYAEKLANLNKYKDQIHQLRPARKERWDVFDIKSKCPELLKEFNQASKKPQPSESNELVVKEFRIPVTKRHMHSLKGSNWLTDEVCNYYFEMIKQRNETNETLPKIHIFNTFFFPTLSDRGHAGVRTWTRKFDLFAKDIVIIPIHLSVHWTLACIDMREKTIIFYDSMHSDGSRYCQLLLYYLKEEHKDKKKAPLPDAEEWSFYSDNSVPKQLNGYDCGVFMLRFADCLAADQGMYFSQEDMQFFRKRIGCEIINKKLFR